ncbi:MAG: hypothetical protein WBV69_04950 [Candidatus Sulfotelmatobacter sp.]
MKHRILLASLFLLVISFASAQAQTYTITDLGSLAPTAINSWAEVVGNQNGHGFVWARGWGKHDLGLLPGGTSSYAASINDRGAVTGTADGIGTVVSPDPSESPSAECSDLTQPFIWTPKNGMKGLGAIEIETFYGEFTAKDWCQFEPFYGSGINDRGQIVGYTSDYPDLYQWGFLWTSTGGISIFGDSWIDTLAYGINNSGEIVGQNGSSIEVAHATAWINNVSTDLGTLDTGEVNPNVVSSSAAGVNDRGQIVGWSNFPPFSPPPFSPPCTPYSGCPMHAVLWTKTGTIRDLGTLPGDSLSVAVAINLFGEVIGASGNSAVWQGPTGSTVEVIGRPFIWSASNGMQDLNTLIPVGGWVLNSVSDINVWGQIVGSGTLNGESHGFLLTPQ